MTALIVMMESRTIEHCSLRKSLLSVNMSFKCMEIIDILMYMTVLQETV